MPLDSTTDTNLSKSENLKVALALAAGGFKVFPCDAATKKPFIKGWPNKATDDSEQLTEWWQKYPKAMPGLPTGSRNGVSVVDLDVGDGKDGEAAARALGFTAKDTPLVVRTPSGGWHLYCEHGEGVRNSTSAEGLDVRGEGGYVIAPGAVAAKGRYSVEKGDLGLAVLLGNLPRVPEALCRPERPQGPDSPPPGEYTTAELWEPLGYISSALYDDWIAIMMAIHHATGGSKEGLDLAVVWSRKARNYTDATRKEITDKWRSFSESRSNLITVKTIFAKARENGWQRTGADDFDDDENEPDDGFDIEAFLGIVPEPPKDYGAGLTVLSPDDCANMPPRDYVVKNLISPGQVGAIFGEPGAGKSVIAPWLGYQVAQGGEFFGQRTNAGTVFYVSAEDELGMAGRVTALRNQLGQADGFRLFQGVSDLFSRGKGEKGPNPQFNALRRAVKTERPSLIVIDTLAMAMPGLEENDAEGMNRVIQIGKGLAKRGAAVVFIHHGTKAEGDTPRGHSVFNGALDFSILVKPADKGVVRGQMKKNRNGPADLDLAFRINSETVGDDVDGDPVTAPVCQPLDYVAEKPEDRLPPAQQAALDHLHDLAGEDGAPVSEAAWRDACVGDRKVSGSENVESRSKAFNRAKKELRQNNRVVFEDGYFRVMNPVEVEFDDD